MKEKPFCDGAFERSCFRSINDGNPLWNEVANPRPAQLRRCEGKAAIVSGSRLKLQCRRKARSRQQRIRRRRFCTRWGLQESGRGI